MPEEPARILKDRLRADLKQALKEGRKAEMSLLRSVLAAIDNAEAPAQTAAQAKEQLRKFGDGAAEVGRLTLSLERLDAILAEEIESREQAAAEMDRLDREDRAAELRNQADIVRRYLA